MPKNGPFDWISRAACSSHGEYLDTEQLLKLGYGNLVLRHKNHIFLGQGVIIAVVLLALFWVVSANWDIIASGKGLSGKGTAGDSYEIITSVINLAPPPSSAPEPASPTSAIKAEQAKVGKIIKVTKEEVPPEQTAATQTELKQALQNHTAGSASGSESTGIEGLGEEGSMFESCDKMPGFLDQIKPAYPEAARVSGITGKVFVKALISEEGRAMKAIVMKRIPAECLVFDSVALKSVVDSKYYPGIKNGRPVKVWCVVPISFQLN